MRRRLVVLAAANTVMVALAFLIPLAVLVRTLARDRALNGGRARGPVAGPRPGPDPGPGRPGGGGAGHQRRCRRAADHLPARRHPVGKPQSAVAGAVQRSQPGPGPPGPGVLRRHPGGAEVLVPVALARSETAVVRVYVPDSLLAGG